MGDQRPQGLHSKPKQPRVCLKCNKTFPSAGAGNRICPKCNKSNSKVSSARGRIQVGNKASNNKGA